jgi:hypothetical protein
MVDNFIHFYAADLFVQNINFRKFANDFGYFNISDALFKKPPLEMILGEYLKQPGNAVLDAFLFDGEKFNFSPVDGGVCKHTI